MNKNISEGEIIAKSFKQLIKKNKQNYCKAITFEEKEKIVDKFICDPDISYDFLNFLLEKTKNSIEQERENCLDTFEEYFPTLIYSLSSEANRYFYESFRELRPEDKEILSYKYQYFMINEPIDNFKTISDKYSLFIAEIKDREKTKKNIKNIECYIDQMSEIYNVDLGKYYFPPLVEYPIYIYNFYSFLFFKLLKKFMLKKKELFNDYVKEDLHYTFDEKVDIYYCIGKFFKDANIIKYFLFCWNQIILNFIIFTKKIFIFDLMN